MAGGWATGVNVYFSLMAKHFRSTLTKSPQPLCFSVRQLEASSRIMFCWGPNNWNLWDLRDLVWLVYVMNSFVNCDETRPRQSVPNSWSKIWRINMRKRGKTERRKNWKKQEETKSQEEKVTENRKKLKDVWRYWKILKDTGRNGKEMGETGRKRKKQEETEKI